ncbi:T9SS type A sorting domain-containing protein [Candidatus Latescibacterota bacterium]
MRILIFCILILLIIPCYSADCSELEIFKEILGHPLENSRQPIAVDKDGMIWVCSGSLVFRYNGSNWEDFTEISGGASLVSASSDGVLWFANEGTLARFDGTDWSYFTEEIGSPEYINKISAGPDNIIWFVFNDSGLYKLVRFDGEELIMSQEELLQNYVSRITATSDGGVWVVYHNFFDAWDCSGDSCPVGTSYFDGTTFHHYIGENGFPTMETSGPDVRWIIQDAESGKIYAECFNDIYTFTNDMWVMITRSIPKGIPVYGQDGKMWYGYFGYPVSILGIFHNNELTYYDVSDISQTLRHELQTKYTLFSYIMEVALDGMVWMGFIDGIIKIDPSELAILGDTYIEQEPPTAFSNKISSHPNPFNSSTTLTYSISKSTYVFLEVYSITGQKVATLVDGFKITGEHSVVFDGTDCASGLYFYRLNAGGFEKTGRMILVK